MDARKLSVGPKVAIPKFFDANFWSGLGWLMAPAVHMTLDGTTFMPADTGRSPAIVSCHCLTPDGREDDGDVSTSTCGPISFVMLGASQRIFIVLCLGPSAIDARLWCFGFDVHQCSSRILVNIARPGFFIFRQEHQHDRLQDGGGRGPGKGPGDGCQRHQDVMDAEPESLAEDDEKELSVVHPARCSCCRSKIA